MTTDPTEGGAPGSPAPSRTPVGLQRAITLGTELAAGMLVFSLIGYWLDRRSGGGIGWTLGGMFMGLVYGGYAVWKIVRSVEAEGKKKPADAGKKEQDGGSP